MEMVCLAFRNKIEAYHELKTIEKKIGKLYEKEIEMIERNIGNGIPKYKALSYIYDQKMLKAKLKKSMELKDVPEDKDLRDVYISIAAMKDVSVSIEEDKNKIRKAKIFCPFMIQEGSKIHDVLLHFNDSNIIIA